MHSESESTVISLKADKNEGTQLSLDKRAQDKNEDEDGIKTPPPLFKKSPEDNDKGLRSPDTQAKINAARERTKQQMAAHAISSSLEGGWSKPKQRDQRGQWSDRSNQDKDSAPKKKGRGGALVRTIMFPHGTRPFNYSRQSSG